MNKAISQLLSHTSVYTLGRLIPAIVGFLTIPIYTRFLGTYGYGTFTLIISAMSILSIIGTGWFDSVIIRFLSDTKNKNFYKQASTILVLIVLSVLIELLLSWLIIFFIVKHYDLELFRLSYYAIPALVALSVFRPLMNFFRVFNKAWLYTIFQSSYSIFRFGLTLTFFFTFNPDVKWIFVSYFIVGIVLIIMALIFIFFRIRLTVLSKATVKEIYRFGLPYIPLMVSHWVLNLMNRFFIEIELGRDAVGIYSASFNLVDQSIGILYLGMMLAFYPALVRLWETSRKEGERYMTRGLKIFGFIAIPAAFGIISIGDLIINLLATEAFIPNRGLLILFTLTVLLVGLNQYLSKPFELEKKTHIIMGMFMASAGLNILLILPLLKVFGLTGAALSSCLSVLFLTLMLFFYGRKWLPYTFPVHLYWKIILASAVMTCLIVSIRLWIVNPYLQLFLAIGGGVLVYLFICHKENVLREIFANK